MIQAAALSEFIRQRYRSRTPDQCGNHGLRTLRPLHPSTSVSTVTVHSGHVHATPSSFKMIAMTLGVLEEEIGTQGSSKSVGRARSAIYASPKVVSGMKRCRGTGRRFA